MPTNWTPLPIEDGGTGGTTKPSARKGLGLEWIIFGTGVPSNTIGANGNYYFRFDGTAAPTATKDHCYFKAAGVWGGVF